VNSSPIVSVVVPAYNYAGYILETLDSVFSQTLGDIEIIVVNDGSTDNTAEVLRPLREAGRIKYVEQANGGLASARNTGFREARGEFLAFLDADDLWPPDKLEWQVAAMRGDPKVIVVYGRSVNMGEDPENAVGRRSLPSGMVYEEFIVSNHMRSAGQALIRADALRAVDGFDAGIRYGEDWELWIRLAEKGPFEYVDKLALYSRNHDSNMSKKILRMYWGSILVLEKHLGAGANCRDPSKFRRAKRLLRRHAAHGYVESVKRCARHHQPGRALISLIIAGWLSPDIVIKRFSARMGSRSVTATSAKGQSVTQ
jgi:glycosyltransferase involved in cell wall biosynthesis